MITLRAPATPKPLDRLVHKRERQRRQQRAKRGAMLAAGCASVGVSAVVLASRRRRNALRGRAVSLTHRGPREYDDVTLARKVESEIFRPRDAPKGDVDVNARDGVVELRGIVRRAEQIDELVSAAAHVEGVARVENLLHLPGTPPRHADPARSSLNNGS